MANLQETLNSIEQIENRLKTIDSKVISLFSNMEDGNKAAAQSIASDLNISSEAFDKYYNRILIKGKETFLGIADASKFAAQEASEALNKSLDGFDSRAKKLRQGFEGAMEGMSEFKLEAKIELNKDPAVSKFKSSLTDIYNKGETFLSENALDIGKFIAFNKIPKIAFESIVPKAVQDAEKYYATWAGSVGSSLSGLSGAFDKTQLATTTFGENVSGSMKAAAAAIYDLGIAPDKAREEIAKLLNAGIQLGEIDQIKIDTGDAQTNLKGLSASYAIAKATGQETDSVNKLMIASTRELGREASDVDDIFAAIKVTQIGTNLSYKTVQDTLMQGAGSLRFYGTEIESMTGLFQSLTRSLGPTRAGLAVPMFEGMIKGMSSMSDATKGFIAMSTGLAGPGGAISGILAMEDALAEGDIDGIIDRIQGTVEKMSGGKILTRQESKDQGKEQQFFLQRKLLSQMTNIKDTGQLREMQNMLGSGNRIRAGELLTEPDKQAARMGLSVGGRAVTAGEEGPLRSQLNRMMGESITAMAGFTGGLIKTTVDVGDSMQGLIEGVNVIAERIAITVGTKVKGSSILPTEKELREQGQMAGVVNPALSGGVGQLNSQRMRPGGTVPVSGTGLGQPLQLNAPEILTGMGIMPAQRVNGADAFNGMGLSPGKLRLDVGSVTNASGEVATEGGFTRSATTIPNGGVAGVNTRQAGVQQLILNNSDEPIVLKVQFVVDNQGALIGDILDASREVGLALGRQESSGE